jgi:hypothetical protein
MLSYTTKEQLDRLVDWLSSAIDDPGLVIEHGEIWIA